MNVKILPATQMPAVPILSVVSFVAVTTTLEVMDITALSSVWKAFNWKEMNVVCYSIHACALDTAVYSFLHSCT